jgi:hypothetical protein
LSDVLKVPRSAKPTPSSVFEEAIVLGVFGRVSITLELVHAGPTTPATTTLTPTATTTIRREGESRKSRKNILIGILSLSYFWQTTRLNLAHRCFLSSEGRSANNARDPRTKRERERGLSHAVVVSSSFAAFEKHHQAIALCLHFLSMTQNVFEPFFQL